jgi:hypothetical protein
MKRFLNKCRKVEVQPVSELTKRFQLSSGETAEHNEIVIGVHNSTNYLFLARLENSSIVLYNMAFDDFSFDFLTKEKAEIDDAFDDITNASYSGSDIDLII